MAKKTSYMPPTPQEDELTVTVFRFRGSSESMQKGFEAFGAALGAALGTGAPPAPRQVNGARKHAAELGPAAETTIEAETVETPDDDNGSEVEIPTAGAALKKTVWKAKGTFLPDFALSPDGQPSLVDFCTGRKPKTENEKYLLVSQWLMKHGGADPFTPNHVFTCFQALHKPLGWKTQADIMQPIRGMKSKGNLYTKTERGLWKLTQPGLAAADAVEAADKA